MPWPNSNLNILNGRRRGCKELKNFPFVKVSLWWIAAYPRSSITHLPLLSVTPSGYGSVWMLKAEWKQKHGESFHSPSPLPPRLASFLFIKCKALNRVYLIASVMAASRRLRGYNESCHVALNLESLLPSIALWPSRILLTTASGKKKSASLYTFSSLECKHNKLVNIIRSERESTNTRQGSHARASIIASFSLGPSASVALLYAKVKLPKHPTRCWSVWPPLVVLVKAFRPRRWPDTRRFSFHNQQTMIDWLNFGRRVAREGEVTEWFHYFNAMWRAVFVSL